MCRSSSRLIEIVTGKTVGVLTAVLGFLVATELKCIITLQGRSVLSCVHFCYLRPGE